MKIAKRLFLILIFLSLPLLANAATYYVTPTGGGSENGSSWTNAFVGFAGMSGLQSGDTVYISGGSTSATYNEILTTVAGVEYLNGGQSPYPSDHDGQVIIDGQATRASCIVVADNSTVSGDGSSVTRGIYCTDSTSHGIDAADASPSSILLEYIEVYDVGGCGIDLDSSTGCEIAYCYIHQVYDDGLNSAGSASSTWGDNSIHHSTICNVCDDGIGAGTGWDIYNNVIHTCTMDLDENPHCAGAGGHPDGMQLQRRYYRVYNNVVYNCNTYCIWLSPTQTGNAGYMRILNNIVYMDNHTDYGTTVRGIEVTTYTSADVLYDIVIANNSIFDMQGSQGNTGLGISVENGKTASGVYAYNNIIYNSGGTGRAIRDAGVSGVTFENNIVYSDGSHGTTNIAYTQNDTIISYSTWVTTYSRNANGSNSEPILANYSWLGITSEDDVKLASTDTVAIDNGRVVSGDNFPSDWPFDHWGTSRPQNSLWDIGAYEHQGTVFISGSFGLQGGTLK